MKTCTVNDNAQDDQSPKQDIYARITAKIVAALEDGVRPWVRSWNAEHAAGRPGAILTHGGNRAFYRPSTDSIVRPLFETFRDAESYYATLAHETTHWTAGWTCSRQTIARSSPRPATRSARRTSSTVCSRAPAANS
jgi:antirestriction protein ArdC